MAAEKVLIEGTWVESSGRETFQAVNPQTGRPLDAVYPVSPWAEIDRAVQAASAAAWRVRGWAGERFAAFLDAYAGRLEKRGEELVAMAHAETALAVQPRLKRRRGAKIARVAVMRRLGRDADRADIGLIVQGMLRCPAEVRRM